MHTINVITKTTKYPIIISDTFDNFKEYLFKSDIKNVLLVTDFNVDSYYGKNVIDIITDVGVKVKKYVVEPGEKSKDINIAKKIYFECIKNGLDRNSYIVALGGGVVGDICGFIASTYMRGINYIQIPTTLMAQVDSSIGGKTGIDYLGYKNIIGSFYHPKLVYINISTLKTLSKRQFLSGLSEVIKYGLIADKELFYFIKRHINNILNQDSNYLKEVIINCCNIKANIVSQDENEKGLRMTLNFGHTVGHAIESASQFNLLHGECIALGMIVALRFSFKKNMISNEELNIVQEIIFQKLLTNDVNCINIEKICKYLSCDKKCINKAFNYILLDGIGKAKVVNDIDLKILTSEIKQLLNQIQINH